MVCMICEKPFTSLRSKVEHDYERHPKCSKCPWMVFADEDALYEHYETSWQHEYTYCCECEVDFATESHFRKHVCVPYDYDEFEFDDNFTNGFNELNLSVDEMDRHNRIRHPKVTFEEPRKALKQGHHAPRDDQTRRCEPRDGQSHSGRGRRQEYDTYDSYDPRHPRTRQPQTHLSYAPSTKPRPKGYDSYLDAYSMPTTPRLIRSESSRTQRPSASKPKTKQQPPKDRPATLEASLDLYELFRVNPSSSQAEIEKAVKKKRIDCHPDRLKQPGMSSAELRFIDEQAKIIGGAAEVLLDPKKRKLYDKKGSKR
ncbi:MAG: hypothetical protein Q9179_005220 [Wetmoreana sp. 5 TL-2023]